MLGCFKGMHMKYQITYRLLHPQYIPATSTSVVDAHSHAELDARLIRIKTKWQARGYTVQVTKVLPLNPRSLPRLPQNEGDPHHQDEKSASILYHRRHLETP